MSEVLFLAYNAHEPGIRAVVDAVETVKDQNGNDLVRVIVGGAPPPERHLSFDQLGAIDPVLLADFQSVLARLEPIVRAKAGADEQDPAKLREEANRIAKERERLAREKDDHEKHLDLARVEAKRLALEIESLEAQRKAREDEIARLATPTPAVESEAPITKPE